MLFIKKVGHALWASGEECSPPFWTFAKNLLFFAPVFYGITWFGSHHVPSREMWMAFFWGAFFFSPSPKKAAIHHASIRHSQAWRIVLKNKNLLLNKKPPILRMWLEMDGEIKNKCVVFIPQGRIEMPVEEVVKLANQIKEQNSP